MTPMSSAFSSVSMEPPLVLICLTKGKPVTDLIEKSRRFVVNVLGAGQEEVSEQFAYLPAEERLFSVAYELGGTRGPWENFRWVLGTVVRHHLEKAEGYYEVSGLSAGTATCRSS